MASITLSPVQIAIDGTCWVYFVGLPYRAVEWSLSGGGAGALSQASTHTGANGLASALYTPGEAGVAIITVTYGA